MRIGNMKPPKAPKFDLKTTGGISVWSESDALERFRVVVPVPHLAYSLNKFLGQYPKKYGFQEQDEAQFKVLRSDLQRVFKILGIKESRVEARAYAHPDRRSRVTQVNA